jgi:hypothetical protein
LHLYQLIAITSIYIFRHTAFAVGIIVTATLVIDRYFIVLRQSLSDFVSSMRYLILLGCCIYYFSSVVFIHRVTRVSTGSNQANQNQTALEFCHSSDSQVIQSYRCCLAAIIEQQIHAQ